MLRPPKRLSLVSQTTAALREHVASCAAGETLPSERELSVQLGVSRMTLRAAIARLMKEHLIKGSQGRRHVVVRPGIGRPASGGQNVVVLSPVALHAVDPRVLFWIDELRKVLAKDGYKLDFIHQKNCYSEHPANALAELTSRWRPAAWLLFLSTHAMQVWFSGHNLPAVIPGSRYPDVKLPSVDVDYRVTCRHAVGQFLKQGNRVMVLLNPRSVAAGDLESELGFREAAAGGVETIIAHHDGSVKDICNRLDRLLERKQRPTAFLISRPTHALTALGHLVRRGVQFPGDVALIARDHDSFLDHVVPGIACYQVDPVLFAHKISRLVLEMASGGNALSRDYRIIPQLIPGQTLAG